MYVLPLIDLQLPFDRHRLCVIVFSRKVHWQFVASS